MSLRKPIAIDVCRQRQIVKQKYTDSVVNKSSERCVERLNLAELPDVIVLESTTTIGERISPSIVEVLDDLETDLKPAELARCFDALENYALNLIDFPWKKEFHTILMYCGFYKACLEPYLHYPQRLFQLIGYERVPNDRLFLARGIPDRNHLINCAFDFFLTAQECRIIERIVSKLPRESVSEVYLLRRYESGTEQSCIDRIVAVSQAVKPRKQETDNHSNGQGGDKTIELRRNSLYDNIEKFGITDNTSFGFRSHSPAVDKKPLIDDGLTDGRSTVQPALPSRQSSVSQQVVGRSSPSHEGLAHGVKRQTGSCASKDRLGSPRSRVAGSSAMAAAVGVDEVDALVALLTDIDPSSMAEPLTRKQILTQIGERSSSLEHRSLETDHATSSPPATTTTTTTTTTWSDRRPRTEPHTRPHTQTVPRQCLQQTLSTSDKFPTRPSAAAAAAGGGMQSAVTERPHTEPFQRPNRPQTSSHTAPVPSVRPPTDTTSTAAATGQPLVTVESVDSVGWQCQRCTYFNARGSQCEVCETPK